MDKRIYVQTLQNDSYCGRNTKYRREKREGVSEGTVGSLEKLNLLLFEIKYIIINYTILYKS
jgi:hypothetical protein